MQHPCAMQARGKEKTDIAGSTHSDTAGGGRGKEGGRKESKKGNSELRKEVLQLLCLLLNRVDVKLVGVSLHGRENPLCQNLGIGLQDHPL